MATTDKVILTLKKHYPESVPIIKIISANTQMNIRKNYTKAAIQKLYADGVIDRIVKDDNTICFKLFHYPEN